VGFVNLKRFREDTPGCHDRVHLNNAGAALSPQPVLDAVRDYLSLESQLGGYEAELAMADRLEGVYSSLARLLGAHPHEIALTQNSTMAWSMIFYSIPLGPGDRILTCRAEYASNYIAFLQRCQATGAELVVVDNDAHGALCLDNLRTLLDERVKLVAINHMPTNGGLLQPAAEIGQLLADHPALYLLDACQTVGQLPLDVRELGCDALSATSRKFLRGPRGVGMLYVKDRLIERLQPPFLDLHSARWVAPNRYTVRSDARRFETYEGFLAGRLGLGVAAEYAMAADQQACWERARALARQTREGLSELGASVHDLGAQPGAIVTFTMGDRSVDGMVDFLRQQGINVWVSTVNSARLDMEARGLDKLVRVSPHYYNTAEEIEALLQALKRYPG
jgi:cysteine desulfurase/selenocysteine lyase